ncbi:MAG: ribbon-helix-helix domain-containing protein [Candidatus Micrarchaeota archaeon]
MPIVNFKLDGELLVFVNEYINQGYATSKAEVIRIALTKLREEEHINTLAKPVKAPEHDKSFR